MNGCRRFLGLDGCHLRRPYGRVLLSIVSLDANTGLFPITYCIYESENLETYRWLLELLSDYLGIENERATIFMIVKQKGVIRALEL